MSKLLKKYGTLVDQIGNVQIRKIHPIILLNNLKVDVPAIQRNLNEDHIQDLVKVIMDKPQILTDNRILFGLYDDTYYIIDGHHRCCAIRYIRDNYPDFIFLDPLWIHIKCCNTLEEISETYRMVNKNFPLDEFQKHLLENTDTNEHAIYNQLHKYFQQHYKGYLSKETVEPRVPGINFEKTIAKLMGLKFGSETLLQYLQITHVEQLIDIMENINMKVKSIFHLVLKKIHSKSKTNECDRKYLKFNDVIDTKSRTNKKLYLGLPINWYKLLEDIEYPLIFPEYQIYDKKEIDKAVWNNYSPNKDYSLCYCCQKMPIQKDSCHMGHILARRYGGLYTIDNLRPICNYCNSKMGTQDLYEYKACIKPDMIDIEIMLDDEI